MLFSEWIEQQEFVEFATNAFNSNMPEKVWSAKKKEILQLWKQIQPNQPIHMMPMAGHEGEKHSSYSEDGIRITGSWPFISGVLSHLKAVLGYENPGYKLKLVFRGIDKEHNPRPDRKNYVFYVNLEPRKRKIKTPSL